MSFWRSKMSFKG